jgi:IclR family transcriptional regulator, acetate operon repressor
MLFREQTRVRLSEASEHLGVAHSTAHRLLAMLAYHGFVRQERDSRAYVAGPALVEIGLAAIRQMDIRLHARPVLEDLAASFAETAHLAVLEGASVRYLDAVESSRALRVAARTGATLPANCTASGKAMLAVLPEAEVAAMFTEDKLPALTNRSVTSLADLLAELRDARAGCRPACRHVPAGQGRPCHAYRGVPRLGEAVIDPCCQGGAELRLRGSADLLHRGGRGTSTLV